MTANRPKVGVGVFVIKDGLVLLGKRIGAHGSNTWGLPGGHLEFGESFEQCAKREVDEETGLEITGVGFATATNDVFEAEDKHYVTVFVTSSAVGGSPVVREPQKCVEWKWFSWDDFPSSLFLALKNLRESGFNPVEK